MRAKALPLLTSLGALGSMLLPAGARAQSPEFIAARSLYAAASYEDALARLSVVSSADDVAEVEQYKALCFVALGRLTEAQQALDGLVAKRPLWVMKESEVSPRVVAMYLDARKRVLPLAIKARYSTAKASYDAKQFEVAGAQFSEVLAILATADLGDGAAVFGDLKMLAEGFAKLAEGEAAATKPAPPAEPPSPPAATASPETTSAAPPPPAPKIYSADDKEVVPPTGVSRNLPPWKPPLPALLKIAHRGILELLVDESGAVTSATVRQSVSPFYDPALVEAAKRWTYKPATRNGEVVKYRILMEINLVPDSRGKHD